tara:strand:- start:65 stop:316 length:252 start_codon:yes stop_codon:yes gene_type:complete
MAYYTATNTGKGFITHTDNESAHVAGYPGDVWVTENSTWATRVSATSKTKAEAQLLVDAAVSGSYYMEGALSGSAVSGTIILP